MSIGNRQAVEEIDSTYVHLILQVWNTLGISILALLYGVVVATVFYNIGYDAMCSKTAVDYGFTNGWVAIDGVCEFSYEDITGAVVPLGSTNE